MTFQVRQVGETQWYVKYETEDMFPRGVRKGKCEAKLWIPKDEFNGTGPEMGLYPPMLNVTLSITEEPVVEPIPVPEPKRTLGAYVDDEFHRIGSITDDDIPF